MLRKAISLLMVFLIIITFIAGCSTKKSSTDSEKEHVSDKSTESATDKEVKTIPKVYYITNSGKLAATQTSNSTKEALEAVKHIL